MCPGEKQLDQRLQSDEHVYGHGAYIDLTLFSLMASQRATMMYMLESCGTYPFLAAAATFAAATMWR